MNPLDYQSLALRGEWLCDVELAALDPSQYYFRTAPTFRTGDARYLWLNKILAVGIGRFTATGLGYRIYRIN